MVESSFHEAINPTKITRASALLKFNSKQIHTSLTLKFYIITKLSNQQHKSIQHGTILLLWKKDSDKDFIDR